MLFFGREAIYLMKYVTVHFFVCFVRKMER